MKETGPTLFPFFGTAHLPFPDHVHHLISPARVRHAVSTVPRLENPLRT
jgi:hypothetical protein